MLSSKENLLCIDNSLELLCLRIDVFRIDDIWHQFGFSIVNQGWILEFMGLWQTLRKEPQSIATVKGRHGTR